MMSAATLETYGLQRNRIKKDGHMDNPQVIGERLRALRVGLGHEHSAAGFARLVDMTPQAWNNYERGLRRISLDEANKLVRKFGLPLDWIFYGTATDRLPLHIAKALGLVVDARHSRRDANNSR